MIDPKKIENELRNKATQILSETGSSSQSVSEVSASQTHTMRIVFESKDYSLSVVDETAAFGLRTIVDGKLGFTVTNSLGERDIKNFVEEAKSLAHLSPKSEHNSVFSEPRGDDRFENFDGALAQATPRDLVHWAEAVIQEAKKDWRVAIDRAEISIRTSSWGIWNSLGVDRVSSQTACDWFVMGMGKTSQEVSSFDYDGSTVCQKKRVEDEIVDSISRFRESAINSLGTQKTKSYRGPVLFHPYAVLDILGDLITSNCNGIAHADGVSRWKGMLGERIASEQLTAFEDPSDKNRPSGWNPFDREGALTHRRDIIADGVLKHIGHNTFTASRMKTTTTGNASGGPSQLPKVGFSNFGLSGGKKAKLRDESSLMRDLNTGLVLKRFSGNLDVQTGDFSGVAKNSWLVENGVYAYPVEEVMVSGNAFDLLQKVIAVGQQNHILIGNALSPYILFDDVSVTAG